jgi:hypothetical protein
LGIILSTSASDTQKFEEMKSRLHVEREKFIEGLAGYEVFKIAGKSDNNLKKMLELTFYKTNHVVQWYLANLAVWAIGISLVGLVFFLFISFSSKDPFYFLILFVSVYGVGMSLTYYTTPLRKTWRPTCFYYSVCAADSLENGKLIEGSYYVNKLLSFIVRFSNIEKASVKYTKEEETCKINCDAQINEFFQDKVVKLCQQKSAVVKTVLEKNDVSFGFANNLYFLADSLFSNNKNLSRANASLDFLLESSRENFKEETYLQKHKNLNAISKTAFNTEILVVAIPILIQFTLWLIFGYNK